MPRTTLSPLSSRKRRKRVAARIAAAVSMEETLYQRALQRAAQTADNNFSAYVRRLVRDDLAA